MQFRAWDLRTACSFKTFFKKDSGTASEELVGISTVPYVTTKNISDWSLDKVSLASDRGFVARSHLLPLVLTAFPLLLLLLFLGNTLSLGAVGHRHFFKAQNKKIQRGF